MTREPENNVADIVCAAGGRLVSRIRLQKIAYLLDRLGAGSGFSYIYHHFGPYSRDLDGAILYAEAFDLITESFGQRSIDGAKYSIFETKRKCEFSYLGSEELQGLAKRLASVNVTVLELAATANWLAEVEMFSDWKAEIVRRKGTKTANGRLEEATKLLEEIGLPPARSA